MATYFVFSFLLLLSHFLFLLSVASELKYQVECATGEYTSRCGNLGEIFFPFTTVNKGECGIYISGCDNNNPSIRLRNQIYKVDYINYKKNPVIIYGHQNSSEPIDFDSMNTTVAFSFNTVNFKVCHHGYDISHEKMFKYYRNCPDYDIYFTSKLDNLISLLPCLPYIHPYKDCVELIPLLEIKLDLESCDDCYRARKSCLIDQDTLNFKCVPGKYIKLMFILLLCKTYMIKYVPCNVHSFLFSSDLWYGAPVPHSEDHYDIHPKGYERHLKIALIGIVLLLY